MRRLLAVALIIGSVWVANLLLPPGNDGQQLRSVTRTTGNAVATGPASNKQTATQAEGGQPLLIPATHSSLLVRGSAEAVRPIPAASQSAVTAEIDSSELIALLQDQLRRVGCYKGLRDGKWNATTRRAMARFDERINVVAALDQPHPDLLAMVSQFGARACGTACPLGARPNDQGYCMTLQTVALATPPAGPTRGATELPRKLSAASVAPAAPAPATFLAAAPRSALAATQPAAPPLGRQMASLDGSTAQDSSIHVVVPPLLQPEPAEMPLQIATAAPATVTASIGFAAPAPLAGEPFTRSGTAMESIKPATESALALLTTVPGGPAAALPSPQAQPPTALQTAPVFAAVMPKHKRARKSTDWARTQIALGGGRRHHTSVSIITSAFGFGGNSNGPDQPLTIVLSKR